MTISIINNKMVHITASSGKVLALKDRSAVYGTEIYGPLQIDTTLYTELSTEEADTLRKELEEKVLQDISNKEE